MPHKASAIKRTRSNERKRVRNKVIRTRARSAVRSARETIADGSHEEAVKSTNAAVSALDRAAQKGTIHRGNAARRKSRLAKKLNAKKAGGE